MDFSQFNAAEQAHMTRVIEKKQVCLRVPKLQKYKANLFAIDAGFHASVLRTRGTLFHVVL